jgi:flavin reductase (DIM6/NTAB) family NADH-FMN oxidoreductase RutF
MSGPCRLTSERSFPPRYDVRAAVVNRRSLEAVPTKQGPVPPFPEGASSPEAQDEYDRLRRRVLWTMPSGLYVIGSTDKADRRNGMTANWVTQLSFDPKLVGVSIEHEALTHELIEAGGCFSVCILDREDRAIVRKFTKPVDVDLAAKTLNEFPYVERATGAPILAQSASFLDCDVRERVAVGGHTLFIGEVLDSGFLKDEATPILRMEDTRMNYGG